MYIRYRLYVVSYVGSGRNVQNFVQMSYDICHKSAATPCMVQLRTCVIRWKLRGTPELPTFVI